MLRDRTIVTHHVWKWIALPALTYSLYPNNIARKFFKSGEWPNFFQESRGKNCISTYTSIIMVFAPVPAHRAVSSSIPWDLGPLFPLSCSSSCKTEVFSKYHAGGVREVAL